MRLALRLQPVRPAPRRALSAPPSPRSAPLSPRPTPRSDAALRTSHPYRAPRPAFSVAMTAAVFFGCTFIAFGPALALYIFTIATEPLRVIFLIVG